MLCLIPHLFADPRLLEAATQGLRLPALETLLARGRRESCRHQGVDAALCSELGIAQQHDYPIAPITLQAAGYAPGSHYWLRADPVHLQIMRDRFMLVDGATLNLARDEAHALIASIHAHFGGDTVLHALHPERWALRMEAPPDLVTTPLSQVVGRDIQTQLPQGSDATRLRAWLNELQMLLFEHPVNQAREARGELPVNSLWLWGGGQLPDPPQSRRTVFTNHPDALALAQFAGATVHPPPEQFSTALLHSPGVVILDSLTAASVGGDAWAWREALIALDNTWFQPLRDGLRLSSRQHVQLVDPVHGAALHFSGVDLWKIWRQRTGLRTLLS